MNTGATKRPFLYLNHAVSARFCCLVQIRSPTAHDKKGALLWCHIIRDTIIDKDLSVNVLVSIYMQCEVALRK